MSKPAARLTDFHACPMVTPGTPPVPHVGGPIVGPGVATVLIGGLPAAVTGDSCICTGPPDSIILGSMGVLIGGKPAARMGDMCAHGGAIMGGCPTVLIGESGSGSAAEMATVAPAMVVLTAVAEIAPESRKMLTQATALKTAAEKGDPLVHDSFGCTDCECGN